jgi:ATP-dependent Clp protease ATP-binding subunit ClpA
MFERFTDRARRVVVAAQEEARMLGHNHIGSEHILLGLLHEQASMARRVLDAAGVTVEAARAQVEELAGPGGKSPTGHIPFTQRAKRILELSLREALEQKKSYIGTEHILLGLIRDADGGGAQILERLGGSLSALRQRVLEVAAAAPDPVPDEDPGLRTGSVTTFSREGSANRFSPQSIIEARQLLEPIDRRLAGIERHLGIAANEAAIGGFSGLLRSLYRRVRNIERHLGIATDPAGPTGPAQPETDTEAE